MCDLSKVANIAEKDTHIVVRRGVDVLDLDKRGDHGRGKEVVQKADLGLAFQEQHAPHTLHLYDAQHVRKTVEEHRIRL